MPTTNPVPSTDPSDLLFNAGKLDEVVSGASTYYTDRLGANRRTIEGINASADVVLAGLGYAPPVIYAAGISLTLATQTVEYSGEVYAPKVADLPFTTSGTFETAKFRLIQGVAYADLPTLVGQDLQDYAALRSYTGRATRIYITGQLVTAKPAGIAGVFQHDTTDTTSTDNGGTIIVGSDGRRWKRDFSGDYSVKWFEVLGPGADETAKLQNAINTTPLGATLNLGSNGETYNFSSTLFVSKTITIIGYGVTLNKTADVIGIQVKSGAVYTGLKGFKLTSSVVGGTQRGIVIGEADATNGAGGCNIRDIHITLQGGDGLKIKNGNGNELTNVLSDFNGGHGINLDSEHTTVFNVNSNVLLNVNALINGGNGIHLGKSSSNDLAWVRGEGNTGYGIYVDQPYNIVSGYSENNTAGPLYIGVSAFDCVFNVRVVTGNVAINNSGNWINTLRGDGSTPINREGTIYFRRNVVFTRVTPTYNVTTLINASLGNQFDITVTNTGAFTVGNPASAIFAGQRITVRIINASGGTLGTVTWGSNYRLSSWVSPANGFSRAIDFQYDGAKWVEVSRTPADVPN